MTVALDAGAVAIAAADLWLIAICLRRRTVLAGVLGVAGIVLLGFASASGLTGSAGEDALVIPLVLLLIGVALYALGQALERLLDGDPRDSP